VHGPTRTTFQTEGLNDQAMGRVKLTVTKLGSEIGVAPDRRHPFRPGPGLHFRHHLVVELTSVVLVAFSSVTLAACGGGAGGATDRFCDEAADRIGAFRSASGQVSPTIIGTLRELAAQAPDELRDDFAAVTEASSDQETSRALADIEEFLGEQCGLDVRA
jgi:hypothetical protein